MTFLIKVIVYRGVDGDEFPALCIKRTNRIVEIRAHVNHYMGNAEQVDKQRALIPQKADHSG